MSGFDAYRASFPNARLTRSKSGVLEVALHTDGGTLVFNGHTHEQFVDLFHAIGSDRDNRVVILTGSGNADSLNPSGDAVRHSNIEWIGVRHEEGAALARLTASVIQ
jgi:hypothetical protein